MDKDKDLIDEYIDTVTNNGEFSLLVDPNNVYNFSEDEINFINLYIEYKSLNVISIITSQPIEVLTSYLANYNIRNEIRRINRALYHHQFKTKMLSLDEIGGYLTSLITDSNISETDKLKTKDKINVAQTLINIHKLKQDSLKDPNQIMNAEIKNLEEDIKGLSINAIKLMIDSQEDKEDLKDKEELINNNFKGLNPEEEAYLKSLPKEELLNLLKS